MRRFDVGDWVRFDKYERCGSWSVRSRDGVFKVISKRNHQLDADELVYRLSDDSNYEYLDRWLSPAKTKRGNIILNNDL